jgi:hypothetical protein
MTLNAALLVAGFILAILAAVTWVSAVKDLFKPRQKNGVLVELSHELIPDSNGSRRNKNDDNDFDVDSGGDGGGGD